MLKSLQLVNVKRAPSVGQRMTSNLVTLENWITTNLWSFSLMQYAITLNTLGNLYHITYVVPPFPVPHCFVFVSWQEM